MQTATQRQHHGIQRRCAAHWMKIVGVTAAALLGGSVALRPLHAEETGGDTTETPKENAAAPQRRPTDIRADKVDMDFKNGTAVFTGNVIVSDGKMILEADAMTVHFTRQNRLERIEAVGNVSIVQTEGDRRATAGKGVYHVADGKIILTDSPQLRVGKHTLQQADKITYYQKEEKFESEGRNQRLQLIPEGQNDGLKLFENSEAKEQDNDAE